MKEKFPIQSKHNSEEFFSFKNEGRKSYSKVQNPNTKFEKIPFSMIF